MSLYWERLENKIISTTKYSGWLAAVDDGAAGFGEGDGFLDRADALHHFGKHRLGGGKLDAGIGCFRAVERWFDEGAHLATRRHFQAAHTVLDQRCMQAARDLHRLLDQFGMAHEKLGHVARGVQEADRMQLPH